MKSAVIQVHPIHTEEDNDRALARIYELMSARPGTPEGEELDVLVTLVDAYETKNFPVESPGPLAMIEFRMDQQGMTRKDLEPFIGSRARVSEVLSGKRQLTLAMIRRLSVGLGVSADLLIGKAEVKPRRRATSRVVGKAAATKGSDKLVKARRRAKL
ncbi:MAG TPA: helix-turn-helix domain-containing protein [Acidisarcina sp.]